MVLHISPRHYLVPSSWFPYVFVCRLNSIESLLHDWMICSTRTSTHPHMHRIMINFQKVPFHARRTIFAMTTSMTGRKTIITILHSINFIPSTDRTPVSLAHFYQPQQHHPPPPRHLPSLFPTPLPSVNSNQSLNLAFTVESNLSSTLLSTMASRSPRIHLHSGSGHGALSCDGGHMAMAGAGQTSQFGKGQNRGEGEGHGS